MSWSRIWKFLPGLSSFLSLATDLSCWLVTGLLWRGLLARGALLGEPGCCDELVLFLWPEERLLVLTVDQLLFSTSLLVGVVTAGGLWLEA